MARKRSIKHRESEFPKPLHEYPKERRGQAAEALVEYKLFEFGMVKRPIRGQRYVGDRLCEVKSNDGIKARVPVEVKKLTIKNSKRQIKIGERFLDEFSGIYVTIIQRSEQLKEYDFLVTTAKEMRRKVIDETRGYRGKHGKKCRVQRWHIRIPVSLVGWEDCFERWDKLLNYRS